MNIEKMDIEISLSSIVILKESVIRNDGYEESICWIRCVCKIKIESLGEQDNKSLSTSLNIYKQTENEPDLIGGSTPQGFFKVHKSNLYIEENIFKRLVSEVDNGEFKDVTLFYRVPKDSFGHERYFCDHGTMSFQKMVFHYEVPNINVNSSSSVAEELEDELSEFFKKQETLAQRFSAVENEIELMKSVYTINSDFLSGVEILAQRISTIERIRMPGVVFVIAGLILGVVLTMAFNR